jgi:hypothetical protein
MDRSWQTLVVAELGWRGHFLDFDAVIVAMAETGRRAKLPQAKIRILFETDDRRVHEASSDR